METAWVTCSSRRSFLRVCGYDFNRLLTRVPVEEVLNVGEFHRAVIPFAGRQALGAHGVIDIQNRPLAVDEVERLEGHELVQSLGLLDLVLALQVFAE